MNNPRVDCRTISRDQLSAIKRISVNAVLAGEKQVDVARRAGVSSATICLWVKDVKARGEAAYTFDKTGPKTDSARLLTTKQEDWIQNCILTRLPDECGIPFFLWTRDAVRELIAKKYGVRVHKRTVGKWLWRWDMTPQKPCRQAIERDPAKVATWLECTYPAIKKAAKANGALILWGDESGFRSDDQVGRTYGRRGQTPVVPITGNRFRRNLISAISNSGEMMFMVCKENINSDVFIEFLKRVLSESRQKVVLIVDGHSSHRSKKTSEFVAAQNGQLKLEFLPPYSPDLNPDEYVNHDFKANALRSKRAKNPQEMEDNLFSFAQFRKSQPSTIMNCFKNPKVMYPS